MSVKKKGLGRGLAELGLSELLQSMNTNVPISQDQTRGLEESKDSNAIANLEKVQELPLEDIVPGQYQPRKTISREALEELANSIRAQGLIQPIIVRKMQENYEIIAGERRFRAAQLIGWERIPAIVRQLSDQVVIAISLIENIQRQDLNPIEEAQAMQRLLNEFQMTHQQVAEAVGKSRSAITNLLRLLNLNLDVRNLLEQNHLEMGHARALLALEGLKQSEIAKQVVAKAWSVRQTENVIRHLQNDSSAMNTNSQKANEDILNIQNKLSQKFGRRVTLRHNAKGKGLLIVYYNNLNELDEILQKMD